MTATAIGTREACWRACGRVGGRLRMREPSLGRACLLLESAFLLTFTSILPSHVERLSSFASSLATGMRFVWVCTARRAVGRHALPSRRLLSTQINAHDKLAETTRNIGIIAHIDAVSISLIALRGLLTGTGQDDYDGAHALLQRLHQKDRRYAIPTHLSLYQHYPPFSCMNPFIASLAPSFLWGCRFPTHLSTEA
jgi:hypothetical protein